MDASNIDIDTGIPTNAVSIVGDSAEEFPVLKAFQQYIDAEQNKARKRMLSLCIFFGCLMTGIIVIFLLLLSGISARNQALNDRLIEYVMKERDRQAAVVVHQPASDSSTMFLTAKIEEMQKKLSEAQQKADAVENARKEEVAKAATEAAVRAAREKARIKEEIEVARLKAELAAEREKAAAEKERKRQEEIESYRRKHYPELYGLPKESPKQKLRETTDRTADIEKEVDREIDTLLKDLNDADAIRYFEDDAAEDAAAEEEKPSKDSVRKPANEPKAPSQPASYSLPVEVMGNRSKWAIPND